MTFDSPILPPSAEYETRLAAAREQVARAKRWHIHLGNLRLALAAAAVVLAWQAYVSHRVAAVWILVPGLTFVVLLPLHEWLLRRIARAERLAGLYEHGLARINDRWSELGQTGERFVDPEHPFAQDLDLFGRGSLFQLLCAARTAAGEDRLAAWLRAPAPPATIRARQEAVGDLRNRLALREALALEGAEVRAVVDPQVLARWAEGRMTAASRVLRVVAFLLPAAFVCALAAWYEGGPAWPALVLAAAQSLFALSVRGRVRRAVSELDLAAHDLERFGAILALLESTAFHAPLLTDLKLSITVAGRPASARIRRLHRLVELLDSRSNQLFAPIAPLLLWTTQLALAIEAWRSRMGSLVPQWLSAVSDLEALASLATYAYEHPADPFPTIEEGAPRFVAEGLGHPLLPAARLVRNDVSLGSPTDLLVVSGSNMSGKSTLLRTIGVNAVLAQAGAPVRARSLRLSPLMPGATLRIQDSLQAGRSRFFAEIVRLRLVVDRSQGGVPLLFLLDELLQGTNSHDRRVGADGIVGALLARGAIGLLTTHDLALTAIADRLPGRATNVHFEDRFENGELHFDYRLRPGVVQRSNALELMRSLGLEV